MAWIYFEGLRKTLNEKTVLKLRPQGSQEGVSHWKSCQILGDKMFYNSGFSTPRVSIVMYLYVGIAST